MSRKHSSFRISPLLLVLLLPLVFAACSGSSGVGRVLTTDYLSGALVCLDRNENLQCDEGEPSAVTNDQGEFNLSELGPDLNDYPVVAVSAANTVLAATADKPLWPVVLAAPAGMSDLISPATLLLAVASTQDGADSLDKIESDIQADFGVPSDGLRLDYVAEPGNGRLAALSAEAWGFVGVGLAGNNGEPPLTQGEVVRESVSRFLRASEMISAMLDLKAMNDEIPPGNAAIRDRTYVFGDGMRPAGALDLLSETPMPLVQCVNKEPVGGWEWEVVGASSDNVEFRVVEEKRDMTEHLDVGGNIELSVGPASGSLEGGYLKDTADSTNKVYVMYLRDKTFKQFRIKNLELPQTRIDQINDDYDLFRKQCGDMVAGTMVSGGRILAVLEIQASNASEKETITAKLRGTYKPMNLKVSGDFEDAMNEVNSKYSVVVKIMARNGQVNFNPTEKMTIEDLLKTVETWNCSMLQAECNVEMQTTGVTDCTTIWNWPEGCTPPTEKTLDVATAATSYSYKYIYSPYLELATGDTSAMVEAKNRMDSYVKKINAYRTLYSKIDASNNPSKAGSYKLCQSGKSPSGADKIAIYADLPTLLEEIKAAIDLLDITATTCAQGPDSTGKYRCPEISETDSNPPFSPGVLARIRENRIKACGSAEGDVLDAEKSDPISLGKFAFQTATVWPRNCKEVHESGEWTDGRFTVYLGNDSDKSYEVWCSGMESGEPEDWLMLKQISPLSERPTYNFASMYNLVCKDDAASGEGSQSASKQDLITVFRRVKILASMDHISIVQDNEPDLTAGKTMGDYSDFLQAKGGPAIVSGSTDVEDARYSSLFAEVQLSGKATEVKKTDGTYEVPYGANISLKGTSFHFKPHGDPQGRDVKFTCQIGEDATPIKINAQPNTGDAAFSLAQAQDAHLLWLQSQTEEADILGRMQSYGVGTAWLGLRRAVDCSESDASCIGPNESWVSGESKPYYRWVGASYAVLGTYSNWLPDAFESSEPGDCVELVNDGVNSGWRPAACSSSAPVIIERDVATYCEASQITDTNQGIIEALDGNVVNPMAIKGFNLKVDGQTGGYYFIKPIGDIRLYHDSDIEAGDVVVPAP